MKNAVFPLTVRMMAYASVNLGPQGVVVTPAYLDIPGEVMDQAAQHCTLTGRYTVLISEVGAGNNVTDELPAFQLQSRKRRCPSVGPERPYCLERDSEFQVSRLLSINGVQDEEQEANLLNRLPVVPVVQASELTVSTRAYWYLNRRKGYTLRERSSMEEIPFLGFDLSKFRFGRIKDGSGQILSRNTCNIRLEN
ncbi:hypothetical protein fugu_004051 [Takifugu bimaculatus]|uniref:Uncharacterized protein n=1 Tax=Takifugu bimaculatus TaxID=433685 RepID=A0A4Z2BDA0_9TELE|nr:hypothetical protein fugu_004051 [Takifugu bimaculatus]